MGEGHEKGQRAVGRHGLSVKVIPIALEPSNGGQPQRASFCPSSVCESRANPTPAKVHGRNDAFPSETIGLSGVCRVRLTWGVVEGLVDQDEGSFEVIRRRWSTCHSVENSRRLFVLFSSNYYLQPHWGQTRQDFILRYLWIVDAFMCSEVEDRGGCNPYPTRCQTPVPASSTNLH